MKVYFFGCKNGEKGHYLWNPSEPWRSSLPRDETPWGAEIDGYLAPVVGERERPNGHAKLHHKDGWTALAWWDNSVDDRPGSNAAFFAEGTLSFADTLEKFEESFPEILARFEYPILELRPIRETRQ